MKAMLIIGAIITLLLLPASASADPGTIPLYHYGTDDGNLGKPTAFAGSWQGSNWLWRTVRDDKPGVALPYLAPGTWVRLTVVDIPAWAYTWPELVELIGNSTLAVVAGRPGKRWYGDAWKLTFERLAPLWVGKLYVEVQVVELEQRSRPRRPQGR